MKKESHTALLAAPGFLPELQKELEILKVKPTHTHDHLIVVDQSIHTPIWAHNVWKDAQFLKIDSIQDAAKKLKAIQRNWCLYSYAHHRRAQLITEALPKINFKPQNFLQIPPQTPLGSWTLLEPNLILYSSDCTSPYPNGEITFTEDKVTPPNRAYLKLWELFTKTQTYPKKNEICLDMGASPGGWTWVLQTLGARVLSVDRAELDPKISNLKNIQTLKQNAFSLTVEEALEKTEQNKIDWYFSDIICYPNKAWELTEKWLLSGKCKNFVVTIKFQGETDYKTIEKFLSIKGSTVQHLCHNKHEVTWSFIQNPDLK